MDRDKNQQQITKARRKQARRKKIIAREKRWIAKYEENMAKVLGLSNYKLPGKPIYEKPEKEEKRDDGFND